MSRRRKRTGPPRSASRRYCPNHHGKTGRVEAPGICSRCGAEGVSAATLRGRAAAKTRARNKQRGALAARRLAYEAYLETPQWKSIRRLVIARDGGCCLICFSSQRLHVHHLHYETFGDETGEELATLCERCHMEEHRRGMRGRLLHGPYAAVRTSTAAAELDAEFTARLAREA